MTGLYEEWEKLSRRAILVIMGSFSCRDLRNDFCTTMPVQCLFME